MGPTGSTFAPAATPEAGNTNMMVTYSYATVCRTANSQRTVCHDKAVKTLFDFLTKVQPDGHWKLAEAAGGRAAGKKCSR